MLEPTPEEVANVERRYNVYNDPFYRECIIFRDWPRGDYETLLDKGSVLEQTSNVKSKVFGSAAEELTILQEKGRHTLQRLQHLDPEAAKYFLIKPDLDDGVVLRFYNGESAGQPDSYTALSYCWQRSTDDGDLSMPIDPYLFQQYIVERHTAEEGIWCDQICIDQKNDAERDRLIAAMDVIYRCARVVVIAIHDIEINQAEKACLEELQRDLLDPALSHTAMPHFDDTEPFFDRRPALKTFLARFCASKYFTRAWCSHELRVGRAHCFILKCASGRSQQVCTFTGQFLAFLISLSSRTHNPADHKVVAMLYRVFDRETAINRIWRPERIPQHAVDSWSSVIDEIFDLAAGGNPMIKDTALRDHDANLDRMSIALNSVASGLVLDRAYAAKQIIPHQRCIHLLLLAGLAAGDPTVLCTTGPAQGWLHNPGFADIGLGPERHKPLPRMKGSFVVSQESIQLDVVVLEKSEAALPAQLALAGQLIDACIAQSLVRMGPQYTHWGPLMMISPSAFKQTVATILRLGPRWLLGMAASCGFCDASVTRPLKKAMSTFFPDGFDFEYLNSMAWQSSPASIEAVQWIMRSAAFMRGWLSSFLKARDPDEWVPWLIESPKPMVFFGTAALTAVIPVALLRAEYARLPRIWLLAATDGPSGRQACIEAKCILYGKQTELDCQEMSTTAEGWSIYGRS